MMMTIPADSRADACHDGAAPAPPASGRPRVVIVGAGFGGLAAATALAGTAVDVTIVDQRNHHVFQPLLYQVATAGLSPADIAAPIRSIVRHHKNIHVRLGAVTGIDRGARHVVLGDGGSLPFDWLILATGARHSYFGRDDWAEHAPGLKSIEDATALRHRVLLAMEHAEAEPDHDRRKALLTFVVIGGGPTGVEMAGAIAELTRRSVSMDFRQLTPHCSRVVLVEGGPRLLAGFAERQSARAAASIKALGVEVLTNAKVTDLDADGVSIGETRIAATTIVWAAGVMASPAAAWLGAAHDRAGRVIVADDGSVPGWDRVFAIGDTAACPDGRGGTLPGIAPVAKRQGLHAARAILAALRGAPAPPVPMVRDAQLATIGRSHAVVSFGDWHFSGLPAWLLWSVAHIYFLVSFRNRMLVGAQWLWSYLTFERGARLITGTAPAGRAAAEAVHPDASPAAPQPALVG